MSMTKQQEQRISELREQLGAAKAERYAAPRTTPTVESIFEHMPEGAFSFEGEPEDVGLAWNCDDKDCPHQWHCSSEHADIGRDEEGRTWYVIYNDSHSDGDAQPVAGWDEREGDEITEDVLKDLWFHHEGRSIDHFYWWGIYCLDVAITGEDPLNNWCFHKEPTVENCIAAAEDNLNYLKK